jgi:hypothetical protein
MSAAEIASRYSAWLDAEERLIEAGASQAERDAEYDRIMRS